MTQYEPQFRPGDRFDGKYSIVRHIASGGVGEVYEARHEYMGRAVALKVLIASRGLSESQKRRMRTEAVVLSELKHPNIVRVHDAGLTEDGMRFIAMELLEGDSLRDRLIKGGRMELLEAFHVAAEVGDGVSAAHEINVLHRDIKPENIFLCASGEVKVLDLGTAKAPDLMLTDKTTEQHQVVGTPYYMSPEHLYGEPLTGTTDVYALSFVLMECLLGYHPFADGPGNVGLPRGTLAIGQLHTLRDVPTLLGRVPDFPPYADEPLRRGASKKPEDRPPMVEFVKALRAARARFLEEQRGGLRPAGTARIGAVVACAPAAFPPQAPAAPPPAPARPAYAATQALDNWASPRPPDVSASPGRAVPATQVLEARSPSGSSEPGAPRGGDAPAMQAWAPPAIGSSGIGLDPDSEAAAAFMASTGRIRAIPDPVDETSSPVTVGEGSRSGAGLSRGAVAAMVAAGALVGLGMLGWMRFRAPSVDPSAAASIAPEAEAAPIEEPKSPPAEPEPAPVAAPEPAAALAPGPELDAAADPPPVAAVAAEPLPSAPATAAAPPPAGPPVSPAAKAPAPPPPKPATRPKGPAPTTFEGALPELVFP